MFNVQFSSDYLNIEHWSDPISLLTLARFCRTIGWSMFNLTLTAFSATCPPVQLPAGMRSGIIAVWLDELN